MSQTAYAGPGLCTLRLHFLGAEKRAKGVWLGGVGLPARLGGGVVVVVGDAWEVGWRWMNSTSEACWVGFLLCLRQIPLSFSLPVSAGFRVARVGWPGTWI